MPSDQSNIYTIRTDGSGMTPIKSLNIAYPAGPSDWGVIVKPGVERLSGVDRYEVSANISKKISSLGVNSDTVVIARGDLYPDALSGVPLAYREHTALLLTSPSSLPASIQEEIRRRSPSKAIILGGTAAVSLNVEEQLKQLGVSTIERVDGPNRYAVSASVAEKVIEGKKADYAFIASGLNFPDALSASSIAAQGEDPVLLVTKDQIPSEIQRFITNHPEINEFYVIGGPAAISEQVVTELQKEGRVTRISGADRYEVAKNVADYFYIDLATPVFARGDVFADALSGGTLAAYRKTAILLTPPNRLSPYVEQFLKQEYVHTLSGYILGGMGAISQDVENVISNLID